MRRPFGTVSVRVLFWKWARREPEDSTEESGITIPIQRAENFAGSFYVLMAWKGTVQGVCALGLGGVL